MKHLTFIFIFVSGTIVANDYQAGETAYNQKLYGEAYDIWLSLANKSDALSQYKIGVMHEFGFGVKKDIKKAFKWYQLSAESGYDKVQYSLGNAYYFGIGVKKDYYQAVYWWEQAAQQSHPQAQYNLGIMLIYGDKAYRNFAKGKKWLQKSKIQGNQSAIKTLNRLKTPTKVKKPSTIIIKNLSKPKIRKVAKKVATTPVVVQEVTTIQPVVKKPKTKISSIKPKPKKLQRSGIKNMTNVSVKKPLLKKLTKKPAKKSSKKTDWIAQQPKKNYTLQLTVQPSKLDATKFIKRYNLQNKAYFYKVKSFYKVILGSHPSEKQAYKILKNLPKQAQRDQPWVKKFEAVHAERNF